MEKTSIKGILTDLKYLVKGLVLVANVLPILSGFWIALYVTNTSFLDYWDKFIYMALGGTLIMAGALILNNWYEVDLDSAMKRTARRPTVTGNFSLKTVLIMGVVASILGQILLLFTTIEAAIYGFIGWFTYVVLYTFWTKRRYVSNTIVGSLSGAVTPLIGWATIETAFHIVPIVLFIILFIWQMPHTYAIAMRRYDDYKAANVPMLPVVHGFKRTKISNLFYIVCLLPLPFFLTSIGTFFVILTTVLNLLWLVVAISGFISKDDERYANLMFYSSLTYLTVVFGMMIIISLPIFA